MMSMSWRGLTPTATWTTSGSAKQADDVEDGVGGTDVAEELVARGLHPWRHPSTRPAMSMNSMVVGTRDLGLMRAEILARRMSGTVTTPVLGSMVQKG